MERRQAVLQPGSVARMLLLAALVCAVAVGRASGDNGFTLQGAGLKVVFPPGYRDRAIDMAMADFGKPVYGGALIGKLFYPSEDPAYNPSGKPIRCRNRACQYGCDPLSDSSPPFSISKVPGQFNVVLLDRGPRGSTEPCYFLSKAWNAQQAGADAVLIADDTDAELTTAIVPDEPAVQHLLQNLTVSVALITRKDGELLKSLLKDQATVTLALNWTSMEPRRATVSWELWTTTNDQCGTLCQEQAAFVSAMKPISRALEQANKTSFSPHYVIWSCPIEYQDSLECTNECILNGTYCAPDPDGNQSQGYKGADVLAINVRHLCFARLAKEAGTPWVWWDFAEKFAQSCSSAQNLYTPDCAKQVFKDVNGNLLLNGNGTARWEECVASGSPSPAPTNGTYLPLFEQELAAQAGSREVAAVSILPTVRINGRQYRGTLDAASVMRAICAAFPVDQEPSVCNEGWVSEDECKVSAVGYKNCRVSDPASGGRTRCINTFSGYRCDCGQGWMRSVKADTNEEVCEDVNECLATNVRVTNPDCSCARCACVNTPGSYKCTGELPDKCTAQYNFGGCWQATYEGKLVHACVDTVTDYQRLASRGGLTGKEDWFACKCPGCTAQVVGSSDAAPTCAPACAMSKCVNNQCAADPAPVPSGGGGSSGGGGGSSGGSSFGSMLLVVLLTVGLTVGGLYAVYHYVLKQRMEGEIRDIMSQYMPLDGRAGGPGGGRGGGGGARGRGALDPVDEGDEREDAPLMGLGAGGSARVAAPPAFLPPGNGVGRPLGSTPSGGAPTPPTQLSGPAAAATQERSGSLLAPGEQRTPFGSLISPQASGVTPPASAGGAAAGYQPPAPLPDDDADVAGLMPSAGLSATAAATARARSAGLVPEAHDSAAPGAAKPPMGDAPLLGEGPL